MSLSFALVLFLAQVSTPAPTASPCNADVEVQKPAIPVGFSLPSEATALSATVAVLVEPDGSIKNAKIYKSSGDLSFDMASVSAARRSTYKPKLVDCKPVEATFLFKTSLTPNG